MLQIESLKDLNKLLLLCNKQGVKSITIDNMTIILNEQSLIASNKKSQQKQTFTSSNSKELGFFDPGAIPESQIETPDELTEDQLLFYSAQTEEASQ